MNSLTRPLLAAPSMGWFALFVGLQIAVVGAWLWMPGSWPLIGLGVIAGLGYLVALMFWPWLIVPALVGSTALDITGKLVQETAIGIPVTGFHLSLLLMLYALAANTFLRRRRNFPTFELAWPLALFLGVVGLSLTWSPNHPEATISFMRLLALSAFLYLSTVLIDGRPALWATILSMSAAMIGAAILGIIQILTEDFYLPASFVIAVGANAPRATGTFHNPNTFGTFMMVGLVFLTGVYLLAGLNKRQRLFVLAGVVAAAAGLVVTFSRSNWLAAMIGIGILLTAAGRLKHLLGVAFAALLAILAVKEFVPFADHIFQRFVSIFTFLQDFDSTARVSSSGRVYFVLAGLGMFLDNPLFGAGWRAFPVILDAYKPEGFPHWLPTRESHTLFSTIMAELGIVGMVAAGFILWRSVQRGRQALAVTTDPLIKGSLASLLAVFIAFQVSLSFTADYGNNFLWFFTGVLFAVIRLAEADPAPSAQ